MYKWIRCMLCGDNIRIHRHHIDGNEQNEAKNNIVNLCAFCHTRLHYLQTVEIRDVLGKLVILKHKINDLLGIEFSKQHQLHSKAKSRMARVNSRFYMFAKNMAHKYNISMGQATEMIVEKLEDMELF